MVDKNLQAPKAGMNRDSASFETAKEYYSFALNANVQDEHGSGQIVIQNEPSNILCTGFKEGYRVIGHRHDARTERTFFFLTNPTTGFSEIGYINTLQEATVLSPNESITDGNIEVILETPLENTTQTFSCVYNTIVSDACEGSGSGCLNFSIYYPIKEANIHVKHGKRGMTLWWTDNMNPQRFLDVDNLDQYTILTDNCTDEETSVCLDCERMRVFPLFGKPCLTPRTTQFGGNLRAGIYEVLIGGSDEENNILTNLYAQTNPIPVFDRNNIVLDQTVLDYETNLSFSVDIDGFDDKFDYFTIIVLYRNGLDNAQTAYKFGPFPNTRTSVSINTLQGKERIDIRDVISRRPHYTRAEGLANSNGYLYHYGLTQHREYNLQPIVNLLGGFARWNTYMAKERLFSEAEGVAKYRQYMRDEVYPFSIRFYSKGGFETAVFPFIARPPRPEEMEELGTEQFPTNTETDSVLAYNKECGENERIYRWQFENTAEETDVCTVPAGELDENTIERLEEITCIIRDEEGEILPVDTITEGSIIVPYSVDLIDYINANIQNIINSSGTNGEEIRDILSDPSSYEFSCDPDFGDNCGEPELVPGSEQIFALSVDTQSIEIAPIPPSESDITSPISLCPALQSDNNGNPVEDTTFMSSFMAGGESVYLRNPASNASCGQSLTPPFLLSTPQIEVPQHHNYAGQLNGANTLRTNKSVTSTQSNIVITFTGTSGTCTIGLGAFSYEATFSGSLSGTASQFITDNAANILTDTGLTATAVDNTVTLTGNYANFYTVVVTLGTGNLSANYDGYHFSDVLHSNAIWFNVPFNGFDSRPIEIARMSCNLPGPNETLSIRVSLFVNCSSTSDVAVYSTIIPNISIFSSAMLFLLQAADFGGIGGTAFIAIDTPLRARTVGANNSHTLTTTCGCFGVYQREELANQYEITYTNLRFAKRQTWRATCEYTLPILNNNCEAVPYRKGLFSYWESKELYPCNKELYDSSTLIIRPEDIPTAFQDEFETYYTSGLDSDGNYILLPETDFRDKPIRHFKFPDNRVAPYMSTDILEPDQESYIYPIGFHIPEGAIEAFLDIAVNNQLLTIQERDQITHYEIFRGDRRTDKSVVAKGILFDMYKYREDGRTDATTTYYPNYPLNSLGTDTHNNVRHPFNSTKNNFFTFHSPETHFEKPTLTNELRVEGYVMGNARHEFDEVRNHPTYVLLGQKSYDLAGTLAGVEQALEILTQTGQLLVNAAQSPAPWSAVASGIIAGVYTASIIGTSVFRIGELRYKWINIFKNLGKPNQFAYYQTAIGHYNRFLPNNEVNQTLRGIAATTYLKDGRWNLPNENNPGESFRINNLDREYNVAIHLGDTNYAVSYPTAYINYDNSGTSIISAVPTSSRQFYQDKGRSEIIQSNAASPYAAIKRYVPSQYGSINSITWFTTGYCGVLGLGDDCSAAFGGDIFISRFALKRKFPHFRTNACGLAPLTPFKYTDYFNVNAALAQDDPFTLSHLFVDYEVNEDNMSAAAFLFPSDNTRYKLRPFNIASAFENFYIKPPAKFYLFSYGIPHFLVESEINCNFRYAKRENFENFYPNVSDVVEWTQEENVSIRQPNTFFYNSVYSGQQTLVPFKTLPDNFKREVFDKLNNLENTVIYSRQDVSETSLYDPWRAYRAADSYDFSQSYGKLVSLKGIESVQLIALFENGFEIFGSVDLLADRLTPEIKNLGTGGIFAGRPASFNRTDTGHQGSQNNAILSCEAGHFWVDAKRGKVFNLAPGGKQIKEVSRNEQGVNTGIEKWFKDQLPFKILRFFPDLDIDNNYNFMGITLGWDDRLKRVFLTKKDYTPKRRDIRYTEGIGFHLIVNQQIQPISVSDPRYFTDCSWTVAYNPYLGTWISYYSFKPNYYASYNNYFQTGRNEVSNQTEFGLWSHLPFTGSWQVFYGKLYPFEFEYPIVTKAVNGQLQFIEYWLETRKYYDKHNYTDALGIGFNKAYVYNTYQNTGLLELIHQTNDNPIQLLQYPNYLPDSVQVLQSEIAGKWSFNHMYNAINRENQGLPVFLNDPVNIEKTFDNRILQQQRTFQDYLRGDYFLVRLINDKESRYKFLFRFGVDYRNLYPQ